MTKIQKPENLRLPTRRLTPEEVEKLKKWDYIPDSMIAGIRNRRIPIVEKLHRRISESVGRRGVSLYMSNWHSKPDTFYGGLETVFAGEVLEGKSCGTHHCRAGWAIHLAGRQGYKLEHDLNDSAPLAGALAGALIYLVSTGEIPDFFEFDNETALRDIRACAHRERNRERRQKEKQA